MPRDISAAETSGPTAVAGVFLLVLGVSFFAFADGVAKLLFAEFHVLQVLWARFALFFAPMLLVLGPRRWAAVARTDRPGLQIGRACLTTLSALLVVAGLQWLSLTDLTAIIFTMPLFLTALSIPLLGERVSGIGWLAVLAGFAGALVIARPGSSAVAWAALLPLGTAAFTALYNIASRALRTANPLTLLFYTELVGTVLTTAAVVFVWRTPASLASLALLALTGALHGLGHLALIHAFRRAPASTLAPFGYAQLVAAMIFGLVVLGEAPDATTLLGTAIIVGAGLVAVRARRPV